MRIEIRSFEGRPLVRKNLGFDRGQETGNFELSYLGQEWDFYATLVRTQYRGSSQEDRRGWVASAALNLDGGQKWGMHKIGVSSLAFSDDRNDRSAQSLWWLGGFSAQFYTLAEFNYQVVEAKSNGGDRATSALAFLQAGYEVLKGVVGYSFFEWQDEKDSSRTTRAHGLGVQFLPRPHFEIKAELQQRYDPVPAPRTEVGLLLFHYYF